MKLSPFNLFTIKVTLLVLGTVLYHEVNPMAGGALHAVLSYLMMKDYMDSVSQNDIEQ